MNRDAAQFVVAGFEPAYLAAGRVDELRARAAEAVAGLRECRSCPRDCGVDRLTDARGACEIGRFAHVSSAFAHFGEESCLRGTRGSGTIFFGSCNLRCVFCQNDDISQCPAGRPIGPAELARLMLALQEEGCHNINFVTPSHVVPQILEALPAALAGGLRVPLVYNTSAYDTVDTLRLLEGIVDIYMPDFKLWSEAACERYLTARDYADRARAAVAEMHRQVGDLRMTPDGVACRGLLVRHLVMPGLLAESQAAFEWLAALSKDTFVNVMAQYHPSNRVGAGAFAELDRGLTPAELAEAGRLARAAGLWRFD